MAYYNNEFDTGFARDEKTGESTAMFTVVITVAEYRDLVERAAKNEASNLADAYWKMKKENIDLRTELADLRIQLADLRKKLAEEKEAAE